MVTLEGVDEAERQTFADAFAACGGLQCGFCIPGIVMRAKAQIDKKGAELTRDKMAPHLGAHLCRCTGYVKILDAIEAVAHGDVCAPALSAEIGGGGAKYEAAPLTLGDRGYIDDIRVPGMLHAALHLTDHARADVHGDRHLGRARCARGRGRVHRRRSAGRVAGRADPQGLAGDDPGRWSHVVRRVTCSPSWSPTPATTPGLRPSSSR